MTAADVDLATLVRNEVARQLGQFQLMVVESLQADGTVNLRWGTTVINGVSANQSYSPRAAGDTVLVLKYQAGWRVIDKAGPPAASNAEVQAMDFSFASPEPESGQWVNATQVWVAEGKLYVQTGEGPGSWTPGADASTPPDALITPTEASGYRAGIRAAVLAQGAPADVPTPYTTIWTYGTQIADACVGKDVAMISVRLQRSSTPHGSSSGVWPKLALHGSLTTPNETPTLTMPWTAGFNKITAGDDLEVNLGLGLGENGWFTIPSEQAAELVAGTLTGVGSTAGVGDTEYLIYDPNCGDIKITFQ